MESILNDPTVIRAEQRVLFHIAEFTAIRNEMVEEFKMVPANFRYAATLSGGIAAWLLTTHPLVSGQAANIALKSAYWLPFLLTCLLGGLTRAYHKRSEQKHTYLKRVEDALGFPNLGSEKEKEKLRKGQDPFNERPMYFLLWATLGVIGLLLAIVSIFGLSS